MAATRFCRQAEAMSGPEPTRIVAPRVWVTRSAPGAMATSNALRPFGLDPITAPLIETRALSYDLSRPLDFDAVAFSSPAAVRLFGLHPEISSRPVLTVGDATALAARQAGWRDVESADGDVSALAALIISRCPGGRILHPCARIPAGDLADAVVRAGCHVTRLPVYETCGVAELPDSLLSALQAAPIAGIVVQSPSAGCVLTEFWLKGLTGLGDAVVFALSDACAAPLRSTPCREIIVSPFPKEEALLKVIRDRLCASPSAAR